jgi:hypothetical protein
MASPILDINLERFGECLARPNDPPNYDEIYQELVAICRHLYPLDSGSGTGMFPWPTAEEIEYSADYRPTTIVPLGADPADQAIATSLQRLALYSDLTAFVFPGEVGAYNLSYSEPGILRHESLDDLRKIRSYNSRYRERVLKGQAVFLPASLQYALERPHGFESQTYRAPMWQTSGRVSMTPVNIDSGPHTAMGDFLPYAQLMLPYFPGADLDLLARISHEESDAFVRFNRFLLQRLGEVPNQTSQAALIEAVREIHDAVDELDQEVKRLQRSRVISGLEVGMFGVSLGVMALAPELQYIAGFIGSASLLDLARGVMSDRGRTAAVRRSSFYVPYLIETDADPN